MNVETRIYLILVTTLFLLAPGAIDLNAPVNQAYVLRDRLIQLNKEFEFIILPDHIHGQIKSDFLSPVLDFLSRKLKGKP